MTYTATGFRTDAYSSKNCNPEDKLNKDELDFSSWCKELRKYTSSKWKTTGMREVYLAHFPSPEAPSKSKQTNRKRGNCSSDDYVISEGESSKRRKLNSEYASNDIARPSTMLDAQNVVTEDALAQFDNFSVNLSNEAATEEEVAEKAQEEVTERAEVEVAEPRPVRSCVEIARDARMQGERIQDLMRHIDELFKEWAPVGPALSFEKSKETTKEGFYLGNGLRGLLWERTPWSNLGTNSMVWWSG
jgi:hypothetical protein